MYCYAGLLATGTRLAQPTPGRQTLEHRLRVTVRVRHSGRTVVHGPGARATGSSRGSHGEAVLDIVVVPVVEDL